MLSCTLLSTPSDKQVPPDEAEGTVGVANGAVQWIGSSGKRGSETFQIGDIDKKQQAKDAPKLRVLLKSGAAYVFQLKSLSDRDVFLSALAGDTTVNVATPSASTTGNLADQMAKSKKGGAQTGPLATSAIQVRQATVDPNDPFFGLNVQELKASVLSAHPDLASEYESMVLGGQAVAGAAGVSVGEATNASKAALLSDVDFWEAPRHRSLLVEAAAGRVSKKGMSGLLGGVDATVQEGPGGQTNVRLRITDDYRLRVFTKEPIILEVFKVFVPLKCTEKDFWLKHFNASRERQRLLLELTGTTAGASVAKGTAANTEKYDITMMDPESFFKRYAEAKIDDGSILKAGSIKSASASSAAIRTQAAEHGPGIDPTFDLTSTAEEFVRGRRAGGPTGRAGYGLGAQLQAYDVPDELLPQGPAGAGRAEALSRLERQADSVFHEVNRGAAHLMAHMSATGDVRQTRQHNTAAAIQSGSGTMAAAAASTMQPSPTASAGAPSEGVAASAADDLPDLYAAGPEGAQYAPLSVDLQNLKAVLETQGEYAGAAPVGTSVAGSNNAGGWVAAGPGLGQGGSRAPEQQSHKRKRVGDEQARKQADPPPRPDEIEVMKKGGKHARVVLLEVTRAAHDVFMATHRTQGTGFSTDMPAHWQTYFLLHFRLDCEYQSHVWRVINKIKAFHEAQSDSMARLQKGAGSGGASSLQPGQLTAAAMGSIPTAVIDTGRQLLAAVTSRHAELEALKRKVERDGALSVVPDATLAGGGAVPTAGHLADPEKAKSEVIKTLIMLQGYLDASLDAGKRLIPSAGGP